LVRLTRDVFDLNLELRTITDGKGTWYGRYRVIELVAKYNIALAEALVDQLKRSEEDIDLRAFRALIWGRMLDGNSYERIKKEIENLPGRYNYKHELSFEYYITKFKLLLAVAQHFAYTQKMRKEAAVSAHKEM